MRCEIGWLEEQLDGCLAGTLRTLTIRDQIVLRPVGVRTGDGARGRYDVLIGCGAAMGHADATGDGIAVTLHSPELARPLTFEAVASGRDAQWTLVWDAGR